jgi:hypothetical protein|tara:strand:+ start:133 stop:330 length:198 start_codon:yes stop_codon:yes gene_type:complete
MNKSNIDNIITEEAQKLIGYIMPILESMNCQEQHKKGFKKCLWKFKDNLSEKLISEKINNDKSKY